MKLRVILLIHVYNEMHVSAVGRSQLWIRQEVNYGSVNVPLWPLLFECDG